MAALVLIVGTSSGSAASWVPVDTGAPLRDAANVAARARETVAVATPRGLWLFDGTTLRRRWSPRAPVHDLAFDAQGTLWAATGAGVLRFLPDAEAGTRETLGTGAARRVARIAFSGTSPNSSSGGWAAAATEAGVWLREGDHGAWHRPLGLPHRPSSAVAFIDRSDALELWAVVGGSLYRLTLHANAPKLLPVSLPVLGERATIQDLTEGPTGIAVLLRHELLVRREGRWFRVRLGLPPGAVATRARFDGDRYWVCSDRGLFSLPAPSTPQRRATQVVAEIQNQAIADIAPGARFAVGERGLLHREASRAADIPKKPAAEASVEENVPDIVSVQRVALRTVGLDGTTVRNLFRGVRRRGWLPTFEVRAGRGRDALRERRYDEVFSSGATRQLHDTTTDRHRSLDVDVVLRWDLGDIAYHPESIDVSRETRERIELRDEVLDEVTQLYFERRRARLALGTAARDERPRLRLRIRELDAGLDGWTEGWWSAQRSAAAR